MVDVILEIKPGKKIRDLSNEAFAIFGRGGYSPEQLAEFDAQGGIKVENLLGYCNTPVLTDVNGKPYVVARVDDVYAEQIEIMVESNTAKFIKRVINVDGPFMVEVNDYDINGNIVGTRMQEMNKIA